MAAMMTAFSIAYPPERSLGARIFRPVLEPRSYLRFIHLLLMMPLGIAYFTFFVTAFAFGGSLIWTFIGPPVIFIAMFISLKLGDLEAWLVNTVTREGIRRPPSRLEGVDTFRAKVWARIIDPSTWTGLVYEFAQFPIGIGAFVATVTGVTVSVYLLITPLIILIADEPVQFGDGGPLYFDQPLEALPLVPLGILGWIITVHILTAFSALHAGWARLMLGSRSRHRPRPSDAVPEPEPEDVPPPTPPTIALLPPPEGIELPVVQAPKEAPPARPAVIEPPDDPAFATLTAREREVTLLLARGFSNADIAEYCVISEGTVKTHVLHILEKLDLRDRTQVVIYAYEHGLVRPGAHSLDLTREAVLAR
jgi:DNA-binding CsgD family transcriptional regulator